MHLPYRADNHSWIRGSRRAVPERHEEGRFWEVPYAWFDNAKLSLGYRGDFFFGALDSGIDTARRKTVGFYGPFATISFGFGG